MHRFFEGYLYPSYTGSAIVKFRSPEARDMWEYFKKLWQFAHPGSITYSTMSDPLLTGDVWIAWDHTARLAKALSERPNDFVAFPAPLGPKGRGYMAIVSGLAIPRKVKEAKDPALLMDYLTQPYIQDLALKETGFFPVLVSAPGANRPPPLLQLGKAVDDQSSSVNSILSLAPIGLGEEGKAYDNWFMYTFSEIVLGGRGVKASLDASAFELQKILDKENAKSWLPDVSEGRPVKIE
jgi:multiple sugar transport system substrate-binding protein